MADMILASFLRIWHIIPIIIAIILFKKFVNNKDKKRRINKNEENDKKGLTLEVRTEKKYTDLGYKVECYKKQDEKEDQEIDLICCRDDKTLLVQCKNNSVSKSITDEDIKTFYNNAMKYIETNNIKEKDVEFRYVIPYSDVLHKSAIKILTNDSYNCKYVIL
jgi:hypothetical protein